MGAQAGIDHRTPGVFSGNIAYADTYAFEADCVTPKVMKARSRLDLRFYNEAQGTWGVCRSTGWTTGTTGHDVWGPTGPGSLLGYGGPVCGVGWYDTRAFAEVFVPVDIFGGGGGGWPSPTGTCRVMAPPANSPGRAWARPGVMERLGKIERRVGVIVDEVRPNGGGSMRDTINHMGGHGLGRQIGQHSAPSSRAARAAAELTRRIRWPGVNTQQWSAWTLAMWGPGSTTQPGGVMRGTRA